MFKKINKKGFTLAELLIVVAIIGVLVAISIPIFTAQLRKARLATNQANARAAYAAATAALLNSDATATEGNFEYTISTATVGTMQSYSAQTDLTKPVAEWGVDDEYNGTDKLGDKTAKVWTVAISKDGKVSFSGADS